MKLMQNALAAAVFSIAGIAGTASASDKRLFWESLPKAAFFEVYAYYCSPAGVRMARTEEAPLGDAAMIYVELFSYGYKGNCADFYNEELVRRIDAPTQQGLIVVDR